MTLRGGGEPLQHSLLPTMLAQCRQYRARGFFLWGSPCAYLAQGPHVHATLAKAIKKLDGRIQCSDDMQGGGYCRLSRRGSLTPDSMGDEAGI